MSRRTNWAAHAAAENYGVLKATNDRLESEISTLRTRIAELEAQVPTWDTRKPEKDGYYLVIAEDSEHNQHTATDYWAGEWVNYGSFVIAYLKNVPEFKP